jgi:leucyl-tRNA synthetase
VGQDIENLRFNTAISQMMIFTNLCIKKGKVTRNTAENFALVLAPFAPHLAEEIWEILGNTPSISQQIFPQANETYLQEDSFDYPVSFNGKLRFKLNLPLSMQANEAEQAVKEYPQSKKYLEGKQIKKIIFVQGKIINVVVG